MDWLNDKKNQPIVIGAFVLILIVAGFIVWKTNFAGKSPSSDTSTSMPAQPNPTTPPGPGVPPSSAPAPTPSQPQPIAQAGSRPAPAGARPGANVMALAVPMESWRADPFLPVGYKPPIVVRKPVPYLEDFPIPDLPRWKPPTATENRVVYAPQPMRRMAGLLLSGRVYAILESNGKTEVVQPGDRLNDGTATVDRIDRDKVILKTTDQTPRYITVRMAGASRADTSGATTGTPGGTPGPGMPPGTPYTPAGAMPRGGPGTLPRGP